MTDLDLCVGIHMLKLSNMEGDIHVSMNSTLFPLFWCYLHQQSQRLDLDKLVYVKKQMCGRYVGLKLSRKSWLFGDAGVVTITIKLIR